MNKYHLLLLTLCFLPLHMQALDNVPCKGSVKITAKPNEGYEFVKWEDGNTDNPRIVTDIRENKSYKAEFRLIHYTLNPADFGEGVTLNGSYDPIEVTAGTSIEVEAHPEECMEFVSWSDANSTNPRTYLFVGNTTIPFTAQYQTKMFSVTATSSTEEGSVTIEIIEE